MFFEKSSERFLEKSRKISGKVSEEFWKSLGRILGERGRLCIKGVSNWRLLHKGESLCCFRDSALVTYVGMLPSGLTLSALRFILSAKSRQSCSQDCETVDFCNSLN